MQERPYGWIGRNMMILCLCSIALALASAAGAAGQWSWMRCVSPCFSFSFYVSAPLPLAGTAGQLTNTCFRILHDACSLWCWFQYINTSSSGSGNGSTCASCTSGLVKNGVRDLSMNLSISHFYSSVLLSCISPHSRFLKQLLRSFGRARKLWLREQPSLAS